MDGTLLDHENAMLSAHMETCGNCRTDYDMYCQIAAGFSNMPLVDVPQGFEAAVMSQIEALGHYHLNSRVRFDSLLCWVCGSVFVLSGVVFAATLRTADADMQLASYAALFDALAVGLYAFTSSVAQSIFLYTSALAQTAAEQQLAIMCILLILVVAQFFIYWKEKVKHS